MPLMASVPCCGGGGELDGLEGFDGVEGVVGIGDSPEAGWLHAATASKRVARTMRSATRRTRWDVRQDMRIPAVGAVVASLLQTRRTTGRQIDRAHDLFLPRERERRARTARR